MFVYKHRHDDNFTVFLMYEQCDKKYFSFYYEKSNDTTKIEHISSDLNVINTKTFQTERNRIILMKMYLKCLLNH
jgi:hypothetical protein